MRTEQINQLVCMSDSAYDAVIAHLREREAIAYECYTGVMPVAASGSPQAIGHGTSVGGFSGQAEWDTAKRRLNEALLCRKASTGMSVGWKHTGNGVYVLVGIDVEDCLFGTNCHEIIIDTHGVDVSDCLTPTEAIRKVQRYAHAS